MAIIKHYKYTLPESDEIQQIMRDLESQVEEIGEDGDMVCCALDKERAFRKFKEFYEFMGVEDELDIEQVGIEYLRLPDPNNTEDIPYIGDVKWFICQQGYSSDYHVFTYRN